MLKHIFLFCLPGIVLLFSVSVGCQVSTAFQSGDSLEMELDKLVPSLLQETQVPGLSIAVIRKGQIVLAKAYGWANKADKKPATSNTKFQVGSVSKTLTAFAVLQLAEEGKINLDSSIEKYLKSWHLPKDKYENQLVTIRMVLSHTAGLSVRGYHGVYKPGDQLPNLQESLNGYTGSDGALKVIHDPGTKFQYSSGGYTLLQLLIQDITGVSFAEYMHNKIFSPLKMNNTVYDWSGELEKTVAIPYDENGNPCPHYQFTESASGGVYTTASDLAKFLTLLCSNNIKNSLVKPGTILQMITPAPGTEGKYGLGCKIFPVNEKVTMIMHDGANEGWRAAYYLHPSTGDGIILLANSDRGGKAGAPVICTVFKSTTVDLSNLCKGILK